MQRLLNTLPIVTTDKMGYTKAKQRSSDTLNLVYILSGSILFFVCRLSIKIVLAILQKCCDKNNSIKSITK